MSPITDWKKIQRFTKKERKRIVIFTFCLHFSTWNTSLAKREAKKFDLRLLAAGLVMLFTRKIVPSGCNAMKTKCFAEYFLLSWWSNFFFFFFLLNKKGVFGLGSLTLYYMTAMGNTMCTTRALLELLLELLLSGCKTRTFTIKPHSRVVLGGQIDWEILFWIQTQKRKKQLPQLRGEK